jgi:hypothetical protein
MRPVSGVLACSRCRGHPPRSHPLLPGLLRRYVSRSASALNGRKPARSRYSRHQTGRCDDARRTARQTVRRAAQPLAATAAAGAAVVAAPTAPTAAAPAGQRHLDAPGQRHLDGAGARTGDRPDPHAARGRHRSTGGGRRAVPGLWEQHGRWKAGRGAEGRPAGEPREGRPRSRGKAGRGAEGRPAGGAEGRPAGGAEGRPAGGTRPRRHHRPWPASPARLPRPPPRSRRRRGR